MAKWELVSGYDAASHAPAGAGVFAIGVRIFVDDDGGAIGVKEGMIRVGVEGNRSGEVIGARCSVGVGVDIRQVAGVYASGVIVAMANVARIEVVPCRGEIGRASSHGVDVEAVPAGGQPVHFSRYQHAVMRLCQCDYAHARTVRPDQRGDGSRANVLRLG